MNKLAGGVAPSAEDDGSADESRRIWQQLPSEPVVLSTEFFQARLTQVARANRRLRRLRSIQHIGTIGGVLASLVVTVSFPDALMRAGSIGLAVAFIFRWWVLRRTPLVSGRTALSADADPSLVAYRSALLRRIADDSGTQLWSRLAIGGPAAALLLYGFARSYPRLAPVIAVEGVAIAIGLTVAFATAVRRARRCEMELDALNALDRDDIAAPR